MKRAISFSIALIMCILAFVPVNAMAAGEKVQVTTTVTRLNGQLKVDISMSKDSYAASGVFKLKYDGEVLTYDRWERGTVELGVTSYNTPDMATGVNGEVTFAFANSTFIKDGGVISTIYFTYPMGYSGTVAFDLICDELIMLDTITPIDVEESGATFTIVPLEVYTLTFLNYDGTLIAEVKVEEGTDAVPPEVPAREGYVFIGWDNSYTSVTEDRTLTAQFAIAGDFNGDGKFNTGDATTILKHIVGSILIPENYMAVGDFNGDGKVNTGDATAMLKKIANS